MAKLRAIALVFLVALWPLAAGARSSDRAQVTAVFTGFVLALGDRDAHAGVELLSAASLREWQSDRRFALYGQRDEVVALTPGRRLVVFALRHHAPAFLASEGDPPELVSHAIRAGMADREGLSRIDLVDVAVQGDRASGQLYAAGFPSGFRAGFVREEGRWKLDLPSTLDAAGRVVVKSAQATDSSEDAILAGILYLSSGQRPTTRIWKPLHATESSASP